MGSPMAGLLRHDVLPSQPQRGFFSSPSTLEMSTKPLPVSMVTHWELRFLEVARQMIQEGAGVTGKLERKSDGLFCQSNITSELFCRDLMFQLFHPHADRLYFVTLTAPVYCYALLRACSLIIWN